MTQRLHRRNAGYWPRRLPTIGDDWQLGSAGTGDVLAGMISAGLASGLGTHEAASQSVYRHGQTADGWPAHQTLTAGALSRTVLI